MADLGLHGTEAIIAGLLVTNIIKITAGRQRPYVDIDKPHDFGFMRGWNQEQYRSFPSGHSLIGFAAASAVVEETRRWWPQSVWYIAPAMYAATGHALSRMYDNTLASDVLSASIGTFAGSRVKYHQRIPTIGSTDAVGRVVVPRE